MKTYPLEDPHGNVIGFINLNDDKLPAAICDGVKTTLSVSYKVEPGGRKTYLSFAVNPTPKMVVDGTT